MSELEVVYLGMIDSEIDNHLRTNIPSMLEELGVKGEWSYQESTYGHEPPYRNMGFELNKTLTEEQRLEVAYAIDSMFDGFVKIIKI